MPDNAFIHQVVLAVTAGAGNRTGVKHFITGLEQAHVGTDRTHHAGSIPAEDFRFLGESTGAHLGIDRVDRHRTHFDQQVSRAWCRHGDVGIDQ